eukprot:g47778.t1
MGNYGLFRSLEIENISCTCTGRPILVHCAMPKTSETKYEKKSIPNATPQPKQMFIVRLFITLYVAILIVASFIIAWLLMIIAYPFCFVFLSKWKRLLVQGHIWRGVSACVIFLNPFWRVRREGPLPASPAKCIVMCNHLSNADPWVLSAALFPWETKYISKSSLFRVPFGGWCMGLAGDIPIYFTKEKGGWGVEKGTTKVMFDYCKDLLKNGLYITVFPEGMRSRTGMMRDFKDGFFMLACESQTPIVPVAMTGSGQFFPVGDAGELDVQLLGSGQVFVKVGEQIAPMPEGKHLELKAKVRAAIIALKESMPNLEGVPTEEPEEQPKKEKYKLLKEAATFGFTQKLLVGGGGDD